MTLLGQDGMRIATVVGFKHWLFGVDIELAMRVGCSIVDSIDLQHALLNLSLCNIGQINLLVRLIF